MSTKRIGKAGLMLGWCIGGRVRTLREAPDERLVGETREEGDELRALGARQRGARQAAVVMPAPGGSRALREARIVVEHRFQRGEAAVVHVRRGEGNVAQRRHAHRLLARAVTREARPARRPRRVAPAAGEIDSRLTPRAAPGAWE